MAYDDGWDMIDRIETQGEPMQDMVKNPKHYQFFPGKEAIEIIASSMHRIEWYGYCLGNKLKYRLRAGEKGDPVECIAKSNFYMELYEKHKKLNIDAGDHGDA